MAPIFGSTHSEFWKDDTKIETMKRMWSEGYSAGLIANELGCTRNAVISKIHRMGLGGRTTLQAKPNPRTGSAKPGGNRVSQNWGQIAQRIREKASGSRDAGGGAMSRIRAKQRDKEVVAEELIPISDDATDMAIPVEQRRTLITLDHGQCKWGVGDPLEPGFFFCAAPAVKRFDTSGNEHCLAYCSAHWARAHDAARTSRSTREAEERRSVRTPLDSKMVMQFEH